MSGHQYTADMVNDELNQFLEMQEGSFGIIRDHPGSLRDHLIGLWLR